jgi:hypothetical protein
MPAGRQQYSLCTRVQGILSPPLLAYGQIALDLEQWKLAEQARFSAQLRQREETLLKVWFNYVLFIKFCYFSHR